MGRNDPRKCRQICGIFSVAVGAEWAVGQPLERLTLTWALRVVGVVGLWGSRLSFGGGMTLCHFTVSTTPQPQLRGLP